MRVLTCRARHGVGHNKEARARIDMFRTRRKSILPARAVQSLVNQFDYAL